jgi:hypothetical protein
LKDDTHLPVEMDAFWVFPGNKVKLQGIPRYYIIQNAEHKLTSIELVMSEAAIMDEHITLS